MTPAYEKLHLGARARVFLGDCVETLRQLPEKSVHCVVTSPPYYGLRDYGVPGQIGLEDTLPEYLSRIVEVFTEVHRVLRDDGVLWLNLGDSYAGSWGAQSRGESPLEGGSTLATRQISVAPQRGTKTGSLKRTPGIKRKDLMGVPWRVAFALQDAGWYLRSEVIWHKPNPTTESACDRPSRSHETLFLLSKEPTYYYDAYAVREPAVYGGATVKSPASWDTEPGTHGTIHRFGRAQRKVTDYVQSDTRAQRTVWTIPTQPFAGGHFAAYPEDLVRPCILSGSSAHGCCSVCGNPAKRLVDKKRVATRTGDTTKATGKRFTDGNRDPGRHISIQSSQGWEPTCKCKSEVVPCTVLDPFSGAGTTGLVSLKSWRNYIGIELNEQYVRLSRDRLDAELPPTFFDALDTVAEATEQEAVHA
jgi:DNA modification methylase